MAKVNGPLARETELELIRRIQSGDCEAEERLLSSYRRLVYRRVRELANRHAQARQCTGDMAVMGEVAVVRSARRFDLERYRLFFPYCDVAVRGAVFFAALEGLSALYVPKNLLKEAASIRAALATSGHAADIATLAEIAGIPEDRAKTLYSAANLAAPLSAAARIASLEPVPMYQPGDDEYDRVAAAVSRLTDLERDAVAAVACKTEPLHSVARRHCVPAKDVRRIGRHVLEMMKVHLCGCGKKTVCDCETITVGASQAVLALIFETGDQINGY